MKSIVFALLVAGFWACQSGQDCPSVVYADVLEVDTKRTDTLVLVDPESYKQDVYAVAYLGSESEQIDQTDTVTIGNVEYHFHQKNDEKGCLHVVSYRYTLQ